MVSRAAQDFVRRFNQAFGTLAWVGAEYHGDSVQKKEMHREITQ
jgi:hypothetical protein